MDATDKLARMDTGLYRGIVRRMDWWCFRPDKYDVPPLILKHFGRTPTVEEWRQLAYEVRLARRRHARVRRSKRRTYMRQYRAGSEPNPASKS